MCRCAFTPRIPSQNERHCHRGETELEGVRRLRRKNRAEGVLQITAKRCRVEGGGYAEKILPYGSYELQLKTGEFCGALPLRIDERPAAWWSWQQCVEEYVSAC